MITSVECSLNWVYRKFDYLTSKIKSDLIYFLHRTIADVKLETMVSFKRFTKVLKIVKETEFVLKS